MESGRTQWIVERRRYFRDKWEDDVAERVRAERYDETAWVRVLEAIYWWPAREGKQWPAEVILIPRRSAGDVPEPDAWAHFEAAVEIDERYRWEDIPGPPDFGGIIAARSPNRRYPLRAASARCFRLPAATEGGRMNVHGIVWAGVRTERFAETVAFFRDVVALPVREFRDDFAWFKLPDTSQFEIFGPAEPDHDHFVTGPVPSFHVDDVYAAVEALDQSGVETFGPWGQPDAGWAHFRAVDGNIYGLSAGSEYRR